MKGTAGQTMHTLVVTGPARDQLAEHFERLFWSHGDVRVLKDRRYRERRRHAASVGVDRRCSDRRVTPPDWVVPPA